VPWRGVLGLEPGLELRKAYIRFYQQIPPVTRTLVTISGGLFFAAVFGFLKMTNFINYWPYVLGKFQIWRPGKVKFNLAGVSSSILTSLHNREITIIKMRQN
jgi:hypothetical protein